MDDFPVEFTKVMDESTPSRDGSFVRNKLYVYYLGKFGPFTERVPLANFDDNEITRRVEATRAHLRMVHR